MKRSKKAFNRLSLLLAALFLMTASIVLANRSGHPTSTTQALDPHTDPTTTSRSNGFVEDKLGLRNVSLALPTPSPTPTPGRIYNVVEVTDAQQEFSTSAKLGEQGEVVGRTYHGFIYSAAIWRNGVVEAIRPSNALDSEAYDINESDQIIGSAYFEPDAPEGSSDKRLVAYIFPDTPLPDPNGVVENPDNPNVARQTAEAVANNNVGEVIGYSQTNPHREPFGYQALLWDTRVSGNPFKILDPLPGDSDSRPIDINDNGTVVGISGNDVRHDPYLESRAVVWKNGRAIDVGKLPGLNRCVATSINSFDYVVGVCERVGETRTKQGFLWHDDNFNGESDTGELRSLLPFFPESHSPNNHINDQGQIISGHFIYSDDNSNGLPDAGETKDLNSLIIDTSYYIYDEYSFIGYSTDINNRGQVLARGGRRNAQGVSVWSGYVLLNPLEPVIFVPGMAGSVLVDDPGSRGDELWPKLSANHRRLTLFPSDNPSEDIEATDAIRYALPGLRMGPIYEPFFKYLTDVGEFREYRVDGDSSKRTTNGCDLTQKRDDPNLSPNFFVFAYDWRKSNVENAARLKDYVGCVRKFHPDTKINIIAHSMGGLLSRRYILDNPNDHHVTRLITVGTPWLGGPKLLHVLETGEFLDIIEPIYLSVADIKYIAPSLIGAHQLLPSRAYQDLGGPPIFIKDGWDYDDTGEKYESYDYDQVRRFLDKKYCPETPCLRMPGTAGPGTTGDEFHSYRTASDKQDDWGSDSTGVKYFHFYGVQLEKNKTIGQIVAKVSVSCRPVASPLPSAFNVCYPQHILDTVRSEGDGTVPEISGSRRKNSLNLNAPNAKVIRVTNRNDKFADHVKMLHNPDIHLAILTLLRGGVVSSSISSQAPLGPAAKRFANQAQANDSSSTLSYYVSIIGCSSVVVTDTEGNSTPPIEGDLMASVPDVSLFSMAANAKMISLPLPTTEQYTITFNVNDEPLALRIVKGETNVRPTEVIHYQDIVLPAGASAKLVVSPAGFENLRFDSDGNGSHDASVSPTILLSGTAALDITAPTLAFAESRQNPTVAHVTITATDSGTGVRDVNYSTDGSQFQAYTSALSLDPIQTPFISAFATDSAGNRSPIIRYPLGSPSIRISGTVKNRAGNLLSGATITLRGTSSATVRTDISGNYEFANLPAGGFYGLSASLSGFGFSADDRVVSNPITDRTVDFVGEGACEVATAISQPTAQTVCEGSSASFSVTATGTNLSFQWRKNGVPLPNSDNVSGSDSATLTINSVGPSDADIYDVVITASCAPPAASNEARLTVIPYTDSDGDGQGDCLDLDDDNDDIADTDDAFGLNPDEWVDTDLDGVGNNADPDDDGDAVLDAVDNCPWSVNPNQADDDSDFFGNTCDPINNWDVHLVFVIDRQVYAMKADGPVRLTNNERLISFQPALSPDQSKVAFTRGGEIYSLKLSDKSETRLTNTSASRGGFDNSHPAWAPDGTRIVFASNRPCDLGGRIISNRHISRIFSMNAVDGSDVRCLSEQTGGEPTWSPNGRKIAFTSRVYPPGPFRSRPSGHLAIFSINADGTGLKQLTDSSIDNSSPTWSPDGSRIAFVRNAGGRAQIHFINANGSGVTLLTTGFSSTELAWGANNKIAFTTNVSGHSMIYRMNVDGTPLPSPSAVVWGPFIGKSPHW